MSSNDQIAKLKTALGLTWREAITPTMPRSDLISKLWPTVKEALDSSEPFLCQTQHFSRAHGCMFICSLGAGHEESHFDATKVARWPNEAVQICNRLGCDPKNGNLRCLKPKGHDGPGDAWADVKASDDARTEDGSETVQAGTNSADEREPREAMTPAHGPDAQPLPPAGPRTAETPLVFDPRFDCTTRCRNDMSVCGRHHVAMRAELQQRSSEVLLTAAVRTVSAAKAYGINLTAEAETNLGRAQRAMRHLADVVDAHSKGDCAPTSEWGCEARRKLGVARGALASVEMELNERGKRHFKTLAEEVSKALADSAMPELCSTEAEIP